MIDIFLERNINGMKLYFVVPSFVKVDAIKHVMDKYKIPKKPELGSPGWDYDRAIGQVFILWYPEADYSKDAVFNALYDIAGLTMRFTSASDIGVKSC